MEADPHLDAFMQAQAMRGKKNSVNTEFLLHLLGLGVRSSLVLAKLTDLTVLDLASSCTRTFVLNTDCHDVPGNGLNSSCSGGGSSFGFQDFSKLPLELP